MYGNLHNIWDAYKRFEPDTIHIIESPPLLQVVNSSHRMTMMTRQFEWINHLITLTTDYELMLFNQLYPNGVKIELPDSCGVKNGEIVYIMLWELSSNVDYLVVIDIHHTMRFISLEDLLSNMLKFHHRYNDRIGFEQLIPIDNIVSVTISDIHYGCLYWLDQSGVIGWINPKKCRNEDNRRCVTIQSDRTDRYRDCKFTSLRHGYGICNNRQLYDLRSIRNSTSDIAEPIFSVDEGDERNIIDVYSRPVNAVLFDNGKLVVLNTDRIHGIKEYERVINKHLSRNSKINRFIIDCDHHMMDMELSDGTVISTDYYKSKILPYQVLWYQPSSHSSMEYITPPLHS